MSDTEPIIIPREQRASMGDIEDLWCDVKALVADVRDLVDDVKAEIDNLRAESETAVERLERYIDDLADDVVNAGAA